MLSYIIWDKPNLICLIGKQPKWLPKRDQDKRSEARRSGNFKYLGAIISNEGSKPEILSRITQTIAPFLD